MEDQFSEINEDSLNMLSMNILVHAGNARQYLVESLKYIEEFDIDQAKELNKMARKEIVIAHGLQTDTLQAEAMGEAIRYSTLFCHAQDTLMTAQSEILIGEHLINIVNKIIEKK